MVESGGLENRYRVYTLSRVRIPHPPPLFPGRYGLIWRGGRAAEGAPLLREYRGTTSIEGSNPSLSASRPPYCSDGRRAVRDSEHAPVAQLDRASDYGSEGLGFESSRARHVQDGISCSLKPCLLSTEGQSGGFPGMIPGFFLPIHSQIRCTIMWQRVAVSSPRASC